MLATSEGFLKFVIRYKVDNKTGYCALLLCPAQPRFVSTSGFLIKKQLTLSGQESGDNDRSVGSLARSKIEKNNLRFDRD